LDKRSLLFLRTLWENADFASGVSVYAEEAGEKLGFAKEEVKELVRSLVEKGFLKYSTFGRVLITEQGLREITE